MLIQCPSCTKLNRLSAEKVASKPICGSCQHDLLSAPIEANAGRSEERRVGKEC